MYSVETTAHKCPLLPFITQPKMGSPHAAQLFEFCPTTSILLGCQRSKLFSLKKSFSDCRDIQKQANSVFLPRETHRVLFSICLVPQEDKRIQTHFGPLWFKQTIPCANNVAPVESMQPGDRLNTNTVKMSTFQLQVRLQGSKLAFLQPTTWHFQLLCKALVSSFIQMTSYQGQKMGVQSQSFIQLASPCFLTLWVVLGFAIMGTF